VFPSEYVIDDEPLPTDKKINGETVRDFFFNEKYWKKEDEPTLEEQIKNFKIESLGDELYYRQSLLGEKMSSEQVAALEAKYRL
jgi:hypothetical protein